MIENYTSNISNLESNIRYSFKDKRNALNAILHPSCNKSKELKLQYQRFEFLGDAILKNSVAFYIFKKYNSYPESRLSFLLADLVSRETCYKVGLNIDLQNYIIISKGEMMNGGNLKKNILSDTVESIIGAVYFDSGSFDVTDNLINILWQNEFNVSSSFDENERNLVQNYSLKKYKKLPVYKTDISSEDDSLFISRLYIDNLMTEGFGLSKKVSQKEAAQKMLKLINLH